MTSVTPPKSPPSLLSRVATYFYLHPTAALAVLLGPPLLWLVVVYLGSLAALVLQSFFHLDSFTGKIIRQFTLSTYGDLLSSGTNYNIIFRTVGMATCVTLAAAVIAFPLAYYMSRYATPRTKALMYLAVLLPLWSNYLVRMYAWKIILAKEGIIGWFAEALHLDGLLKAVLGLPVVGGNSLSNSIIGVFLVFLYIWLPYMILPIQAALERVPKSLIEASGDLGARPNATFWNVIFPLSLPGVVAGSIFTFSLTLGDFIIPTQFGDSSHFIGNEVYVQQGSAGNIPLAAAFTVVPIVIMGLYLYFAKRAGAFDAL
jgi:putative spermidine/putrescine transport system permease protein